MSADARRTALNILALREHGQAELRQKLKVRQQFSDAEITEVIAQLIDQGLLNDGRAVELLVRQSLAKNFGADKIRAVAQQKGLAGAALERELGGVDWLEVARRAYLKKFSQTEPIDAKDWQKRARFLAGRGFSAEIVRRLLPES